jgi:Cu/Ag efflux protein CusF
MKRIALALLLAFTVVPFVSAHEGHDHKIMGTLAAVHDNSVDVKATDGKTTTITLNDKTKILHGTMAMKIADLKTGDRVVVTATGGGKDPFVAKEIKIGAATAAKTTAKPTAAKK